MSNPVVHVSQDELTALLIEAARGGWEQYVRVLIQAGADVNTAHKHYAINMPLMLAAVNGHEGCMKILLKAGAGVDASTGYIGRTALMWATDRGQTGSVSLLIEAGADVNKKDNSGETPLMLAAGKGGSENCIKVLVDHGAMVNEICHRGRSPLMRAALFKRVEAVSMLIAAGADVNQSNRWDETVLSSAASYVLGNGSLTKELIDDQLSCMNMLMEAGADVKHFSVLHSAALHPHTKCLDLVVRAGADVNCPNSSGNKCILIAAFCRRVSCVDYLIKSGANVNTRNSEHGMTALVEAMYGHEDAPAEDLLPTIKLLLKAGAHVNTPHSTGDDNDWVKYDVSRDWRKNRTPREVFKVLFAAGETLKYFSFSSNRGRQRAASHCNEENFDPTSSLLRTCRKALRSHLLDVDPHTNLFHRVPLLGLPPQLKGHLLYGQKLDVDLPSTDE